MCAACRAYSLTRLDHGVKSHQLRVLEFHGLLCSLRNMVLHYPDVYKHSGGVVLSAIAERAIKSQSAVFLDQLVRRQA